MSLWGSRSLSAVTVAIRESMATYMKSSGAAWIELDAPSLGSCGGINQLTKWTAR
jgi:hypothetical protein